MQELIAQVEELGIEINHTTSLVIIFGIIFLTAIIVHFILHKVVLRAFEKRAQASSHLWLQIYPPGDNRQRSGGSVAAKRQRSGGITHHLREIVGDGLCPALLLLVAGRDFQSVAENGHRLAAAAEGDIPGR